jgi:predicted transcriptional regulator
MEDSANNNILGYTAHIVAAFISKNEVPDLKAFMLHVYDALKALDTEERQDHAIKRKQPAVPIAKSVTADYLICLEDGKKMKMLKRHLKAAYNMTPAQYREKWGLPADYPMVAPSYANKRSNLAKQSGLGRGRK